MKAGGGKQKGGAFEREVCKALSLWVSHGRREDLYWRSAMSGGRATLGARKGKDLAHQAGDITAVHPDGHALTNHFYIECKHVKNLDFGQFLVKGTGKLAKFWKTCKKEALKHKRQPVIIAKQNGWPILFIAEYDTFNHRASVDMNGGPSIWLFDRLLEQGYEYSRNS